MHPWEPLYPPHVSWQYLLPRAIPIYQFLESAAKKWPNKVAIDFYGQSFTFADLWDWSARVAKGLQKAGIGPGTQVALHLPNTPHHVICFFGILMAGGRVVNLNPSTAVRDLSYQVRDSEARALITWDAGSLRIPEKIRTECGDLKFLVTCGVDDFGLVPSAPTFLAQGGNRHQASADELQLRALVSNDGDYFSHSLTSLEEEIAVLQYTGGTTGSPKGAMLTHSNFSAMLNISKAWVGNEIEDGADRILGVLPLSHIAGLAYMMLWSISTGAELVLHSRFDPARVLKDIAAKRITSFFGIPTIFTAVASHSESDRADLSSIKRCVSGAAPLPLNMFERVRELTGVTIEQVYSTTELTCLGTLQVVGGKQRVETVGMPAPHTLVEIVDLESGTNTLPHGECGEICFSGPQVMKGYWKKPQETEESFKGGRFHTGDIGFIDGSGYVTIVDRKKDMLICGGNNVFPRNIETAIYEHPSVAEVLVIGQPNRDLGEMVKAFVALKPGQPMVTLDELREFLIGKLASYEMPVALEIREELPKTPAGKLSKKELVAEERAQR